MTFWGVGFERMMIGCRGTGGASSLWLVEIVSGTLTVVLPERENFDSIACLTYRLIPSETRVYQIASSRLSSQDVIRQATNCCRSSGHLTLCVWDLEQYPASSFLAPSFVKHDHSAFDTQPFKLIHSD
jgi:hypothetical protein